MNYTLIGKIHKPVVLMVGVWDPLIQEYIALIREANDYCEKNDYQLLIVLLDPNPANLLMNAVTPTFDCIDIRIRMIQEICTGAIAVLNMTSDDLEKGVDDFLAVFMPRIDVKEMWLKPNQTMGRGDKSSHTNMGRTCASLGVTAKTIGIDDRIKIKTRNVKQLLQEGNIEEATALAGHFTMWQYTGAAVYEIGWKPGIYEYTPFYFEGNLPVPHQVAAGTLKIFNDDKRNALFIWPDENFELITITNKI